MGVLGGVVLRCLPTNKGELMFEFYFNAIGSTTGARRVRILVCMLKCKSLDQWERECLSLKGSLTVH